MNWIVGLLLCVLVALGISVGAAYFAVSSQNPGPPNPSPSVLYGSPPP